MNGIQEVSGSIPLISTKHKSLENTMFSRLFSFACGAKSNGHFQLAPGFHALHYFLSGFSGSIRCVERYSLGETPWTFLKAREKLQLVVVADLSGDLTDGQTGLLQQLGGPGHPIVQQIGLGAFTHSVPEHLAEIAAVQPADRCDLLNGDIARW